MLLYKDEEFIKSNFGLVHSCCKRFAGRGVEYDDLFQAGCIGLVKAARDFNESLGFAFSTYAVPVILGEIKRIFRDTGAVKVSRSLKELSLKVTAVSEQYEKEHGEPITVATAAELLGVSPDDVSEAMNAARPVLSLTYDDEGETCEFDLPCESGENAIYNKVFISEILSHLTAEERKVLLLRHMVGLTQSEVAVKLGMSQVQISRKERKMLEKINKIYKSNE